MDSKSKLKVLEYLNLSRKLEENLHKLPEKSPQKLLSLQETVSSSTTRFKSPTKSRLKSELESTPSWVSKPLTPRRSPPDKPLDKPSDTILHKLSDKPSDKLLDSPSDKILDNPSDTPSDKPSNKPSDFNNNKILNSSMENSLSTETHTPAKISEFSCEFGKQTVSSTYSRRKYSYEIQLAETLKSIKPEIKTKLQKKLEDKLYFEGIERQKSEDRRFFDETHTDLVQTRNQRNKKSSVKKPEKKRPKNDISQDSALGGTQINTQNSTQTGSENVITYQDHVSDDANSTNHATSTNISKVKKNDSPQLSKMFKNSLPDALETSLVNQDPLSSSILPISQPNSGPSSVVNLPITTSQTTSSQTTSSQATKNQSQSSQTIKKMRRKLVITDDVLLIKFHRVLVGLYGKHRTSSLPFSTIYKSRFDGFTSKRHWLGRLRELHVVKFDFEKQEISCLYELFDGEL